MKNLSLTFVLLFLFGAAIAQEKSAGAKPAVKPALLVIDVQNEFLKYMSEEQGTTLEMVNWALWIARKYNIPVIRVYHTSPGMGPEPGTEAFEFEKSIQIKEEDPKIIKNYPSSFTKTALDDTLKKLGCNTLFLCGLSATGCVLATYFGAMDYDYQVFMLKSAIMSNDHKLTDAVETMTDAISLETFAFMAEHF